MRFLLAILFLTGTFVPAFCQHDGSPAVIWADKIHDFSSQYYKPDKPGQYSAKQALGAPSIMEGQGMTACAWTPEGRDIDREEFITVGFPEQVRARQILIHENFGGGAITEVIVTDASGKDFSVWKKPGEGKAFPDGRLLSIPLKQELAIDKVKVILLPSLVEGYHQIDFIGISASGTPFSISIHEVSDQPQGLVPQNLGELVNSSADELLPVITPDGNRLYFTRDGHPENAGMKKNQDIWYTDLQDDGTWGMAIRLNEPINNDYHNYVNSITPDGRKMLLGNIYLPDGRMRGGVSVTEKQEDGGWGMPEPVTIRDYINASPIGEFCLSVSGKVMLMSAQRPGGIGGIDILVSFKMPDGTWSAPKNLGPVVNTASDENTPFLAADDKSLYYSTRGFPGYGHNDMYVTRRLDDTWLNWSEPENLGSAYNTPGWDAYFTIPAAGDFVYFVSSQESYGKGDIYRMELKGGAKPQPVVLVTGRVINMETGEPVSTGIIYENLETGEEAGTAHTDPETGEYQIVLPSGSVFGFLADAKGFYPVSENLDLSDLTEYREIRKDLSIIPLKKNTAIRLNNLFFDYDKAGLKPESIRELDRLVKLMNENPGIKILIQGHTDTQGDAGYNLTLSSERAKSVLEYLKGKGISAERMETKGFGESRPVATGDSEEAHARNRRVEFIITDM